LELTCVPGIGICIIWHTEIICQAHYAYIMWLRGMWWGNNLLHNSWLILSHSLVWGTILCFQLCNITNYRLTSFKILI